MSNNYLSDIILAIEDYNWVPLGFDLEEEIPLKTVREYSKLSRALTAVNPLIKNGVAVRTAYIWGQDVEFQKLSGKEKYLNDLQNRKYLFSSEAKIENEKALATDGVFLFLANRAKNTGMRVPLDQITDVLSNPDNREEIWFYKRSWTQHTMDTNGTTQKEEKAFYYPTDFYLEYGDGGKPKIINDTPVDYSQVMVDHRVNAQTGWRYGLPDVMAVVFWAKAHKTFLEDQAALVKSYSKIAFKATTVQAEGAKAAAAQIAMSQNEEAGGIIGLAAGSNLQAVGRTAGSVDFEVGKPLAGYVAAGLSVPLQDLLADGSESNRSGAEALDRSKLAIMKSRQDSWKEFFVRLFKVWGKPNVEVVFPPIDSDPAYREMQTLAAAAGLNILHPEEIREAAIRILALLTDKKLPTEEDLDLLKYQGKPQEQEQEGGDGETDLEKKNRKEQDASYGDNTNRSEIGAHNYDKSDGNAYK